MSISIRHLGDVILVESPYNEDWIREAQALGGEWSKPQKAWLFNASIAAAIQKKLLDVYGDDGQQNAYYTVIAEYDGSLTEHCQNFVSAKRVLLRRKYHDRPVECGANVALVDGLFPLTGGTARSPKIGKALSKTFTCQIRHISQYMLDHWHRFSSGCILSSQKEVTPQRNPDGLILDQIRQLVDQLSPSPLKTSLCYILDTHKDQDS